MGAQPARQLSRPAQLEMPPLPPDLLPPAFSVPPEPAVEPEAEESPTLTFTEKLVGLGLGVGAAVAVYKVGKWLLSEEEGAAARTPSSEEVPASAERSVVALDPHSMAGITFTFDTPEGDLWETYQRSPDVFDAALEAELLEWAGEELEVALLVSEGSFQARVIAWFSDAWRASGSPAPEEGGTLDIKDLEGRFQRAIARCMKVARRVGSVSKPVVAVLGPFVSLANGLLAIGEKLGIVDASPEVAMTVRVVRTITRWFNQDDLPIWLQLPPPSPT